MPRTVVQGFAFLLGFWIALVLSPFCVRVARADEIETYSALEARFHAAVNAVRTQRHLIPLDRDPSLDEVARAHSADMTAKSPWPRATSAGVPMASNSAATTASRYA